MENKKCWFALKSSVYVELKEANHAVRYEHWKIFLYILIFFLTWNKVLAQSTPIVFPIDRNRFETRTIDSGTVRIYYALNAVDMKDAKTYDDLHRLDIGSLFSKYYSYFNFANDSLKDDFMKKNPNAQSTPTWPGERGKITNWSILNWSDFLKDFTDNTLTEYANMPHLMPNHQYTEKMPVQNWQLHNESITVAGHLCRKATCRFRGRDFVAWYTPDIPVSNGPWKFGGLPGLIMKVYDTDNLYVFECISVETSARKFPIILFDEKRYQPIEQAELRALDKSIYADFFTVGGWTAQDGTPLKSTPIPYHPLELE